MTGIDRGEAPLNAARHHLRESGLQVSYLQTTAEDLAEARASCFDVVTCLEMLEHVPNPRSVINACRTLVKPGGDVFFATLNRNPKSFLLAIVCSGIPDAVDSQRDSHLQPVYQARRNDALDAAGRPGSAEYHGNALQSDLSNLFAGRKYGYQLSGSRQTPRDRFMNEIKSPSVPLFKGGGNGNR